MKKNSKKVRNPVAKAVTRIKPQVIPNKKKEFKENGNFPKRSQKIEDS